MSPEMSSNVKWEAITRSAGSGRGNTAATLPAATCEVELHQMTSLQY